MKKFLISIFVALVVIGVIMLGCDVWLSRKLADSSDSRFVVWNEIQQGNIDADVLIMGSSRAWVQYSPIILDSILGVNSYNLGINGSQFLRQNMRYELYRAYNAKPKLIIQNIDYFATLGKGNGYQREQFFPWMFNTCFRRIIVDEYFSIPEKYLPFYRYYGYRSQLESALVACDDIYKGYSGKDWSWKGNINTENDSMINTIEFACDDFVRNVFIDYVKELRSQGIKLVFVYAPVHYLANRSFVDLDVMYNTFDSIAKIGNVPILDYTYSYLSYDTAYFYNASHLNRKGAELFTTMLAHDLDSLGVICN